LIERVIQYFKDRTESFDDYYLCINNNKQNCDLTQLYNWLKLFIYLYNTTIRNKISFIKGGSEIHKLTALIEILKKIANAVSNDPSGVAAKNIINAANKK